MTLFMFCSGIITGVLLTALVILLHEIWCLGSDVDAERERIDGELDAWWDKERSRKRRQKMINEAMRKAARWN